MLKKLTTILAAVLLTLGLASSSFAAFADVELIRVVYERTTGTTELVSDLGNAAAIAGKITPSLATVGTGGTFAGSLPATVTTPKNLFVAYFAINKSTNELWVSGSTDITKAPVAVGSMGFTSTKSGWTNIQSYYGGTTLTPDANGVYTGQQSYPNSYRLKQTANQGAMGNGINIATRPYTEASLASLVNGTATSVMQNLYYFSNANTANSIGVAVATITTNTNGSTTITPLASKSSQTITFGALPVKSYGDADFAPGATASSGLPISYSSSNTSVATIVGGNIHIVGAGSTNITASQTGDATFNAATDVVQPLTITKATPTFTWATPAPITYGTPLSATQLSATAASVPGTFAYTPASGTVLSAGAQTLSVTFTPTDSNNYSNVTSTVNLTVNQKPLTITANSASRTYGSANPTVVGFTTSGLVAPDSVTNVASYAFPASASNSAAAGSTHAITPGAAIFGTGSAANYAITYAPGTLTITKALLTFTADNITKSVGTANPALTYTVTGFMNSEGIAVLNGTTPALSTTALINSPVGTYPITLTAGTLAASNYSFAFTNGTLTVSSKVVPVISWSAPAPITYGTPLSPTQLNATADVPGSIAYSPAQGAVLTAGTQTLTATLTPTDTATYATVTVTVTLTVNKAVPVITWNPPAPVTYGTPLSATQLSATSIPGTFVYSPASGSVLTAGAQTLSTTFTPTDTVNYTTATSSVSMTVNKALLTVTVDNLAKTVTTPNPVLTYTITGFVNSEGVAVLNGTSPVLTTTAVTNSPMGTYPITLTAGTLAAANYTFTLVDGTLTVNSQSLPTISWGVPAPITYGTPLSSTQLNATANVAGTYLFTPALGSLLNAGIHSLSVTFTPTDSVNYLPATSTVTLTINKATPIITWTAPSAISTVTPLSITQLNATANATGTFSYSPAAGTLLPAGANTLSVTFTPSDSLNFNSQTASVNLTVSTWYPSGLLDGDDTSTPESIKAALLKNAIKVLRNSVGLGLLTSAELKNLDVAPLIPDSNGKLRPSPDNRIDVGDALVILKKALDIVPAW